MEIELRIQVHGKAEEAYAYDQILHDAVVGACENSWVTLVHDTKGKPSFLQIGRRQRRWLMDQIHYKRLYVPLVQPLCIEERLIAVEICFGTCSPPGAERIPKSEQRAAMQST